MIDPERYHSRICGLNDGHPPWGEDGQSPEFDFCSCCGVEHGYQDCLPIAASRFRQTWLAGGAKWDKPRLKPAGWVLEDQLAMIPDRFKI